MTKKPKAPPPTCCHCPDVAGVLVKGALIYPGRRDYAELPYWRCPDCAAYVGCHKGTKRPLGRPADRELRAARQVLHNRMFDPIWRNAVESAGYTPENPRARKIITNSARSRTYAWLGDQLGLTTDECHIAMFDLITCRRAWVALRDTNYPTIRAWYKARKDKEASNAEAQAQTADA